MRDRAGTIRVTNDIVMSASVFETRYSSQSAHPPQVSYISGISSTYV